MKQSGLNDLAFLCASLHGRRSRLAEMDRLNSLANLSSRQELAHALFPGLELQTQSGIQLSLLQDFVRELEWCIGYLNEAGRALVEALLMRFSIENLKVFVRYILNPAPLQELERFTLALPQDAGPAPANLSRLHSLTELIEGLKGLPRLWLGDAVLLCGPWDRPFFFEAALDSFYFRELLHRMNRLAKGEQEALRPLIFQEIDCFHLMLFMRGHFHYGLPLDPLIRFHVPNTAIPRHQFAAMNTEPTPLMAAKRVLGRALDELPQIPQESPAEVVVPEIERLAWKRFLRLANAAFRHSHMGLGAVVGYLALRRVEVANLITISEGLRVGLPALRTRTRLIQRRAPETEHV